MLDSTLSAAGRIGRYFSIVTLLPTLTLVLYTYLLLSAGAGTSHFDLGRGATAVVDTPLSHFVWLVACAFVLSLLLHPLQFSLTQLLEGYWGSSRVGLSLATARVMAHRRRVQGLSKQQTDATKVWMGNQTLRVARDNLENDVPRAVVRAYLITEAAQKARATYPPLTRRVMPTRLGNVLRRHEDVIGQQYGLKVLTVMPHLTAVANPARTRQVFDEAEQMDLALRMCLSAAAATALTLVLLARSGSWAFLAAVPYGAAYVAYRAACSSANAWMSSVGVMVDLERFALYDAMHIPLPGDTEEEFRVTGRNVSDILSGREEIPTEYELPPISAAAGQGQANGDAAPSGASTDTV